MNPCAASEVTQPPSTARAELLIIGQYSARTTMLRRALGDDYSVSVVLEGAKAEEAVARIQPGLVLLEAWGPGLDGYEVCARLKRNPATRDVPVLLLIPSSHGGEEERGLRLGAMDYLTEPIRPALVRARVQNCLALHEARQARSQCVSQTEARRQELSRLRKLNEDLIHMQVHDLRSPLMAIHLFLGALSPETAKDPGFMKHVQAARECARDLGRMIDALLDIGRLEADRMPVHREPVDLADLTRSLLERRESLVQGRQISVRAPAGSVVADCDPDLTQRILQNLLSNALSFTPATGRIRVELDVEDSWVRLSVQDTGCGIPQEYHATIFDKYVQVTARRRLRRRSTGLGLTFCKLAVEAQGGSIGLESQEGQGTTFHVRLPRPKEELEKKRRLELA